jgi:hypothetical protein
MKREKGWRRLFGDLGSNQALQGLGRGQRVAIRCRQ